MRAAESGINAAVEQPALMALPPDVKGRSVLDLGCGDGRLCCELADLGAARVVGVDPSTRMLAAAREFSGNPTVSYRQAFAEDAAFDDASFDLDVAGGPSPVDTKQQLVRLHCDPTVREPFIARLAGPSMAGPSREN